MILGFLEFTLVLPLCLLHGKVRKCEMATAVFYVILYEYDRYRPSFLLKCVSNSLNSVKVTFKV